MSPIIQNFLDGVARSGQCQVKIFTTRKCHSYDGLLVVSEDHNKIEFYDRSHDGAARARRIDRACIQGIEGVLQSTVKISDFSEV